MINAKGLAISVACLVLLGACAVVEIPNGFVPKSLTLDRVGDHLVLSSEFTADPGEEIRTALLAGVALKILLDTGVQAKDAWPWQSPILERQLVLELQYSALSEQFVIHRLDTGSDRYFSRMDQMMAAVVQPPQHKIPLSVLESGYAYRFHARMYLDLPGLPPPLRLPAYFSHDWRMDSGYQYISLRN